MNPEIVLIVGPTAVGKTRLGICLAERLSTEIISADAMQVYRGLDIGTAAPTPADRARVVHHLVGSSELTDQYSAAEFARDARTIIDRLWAKGRIPVVVGGSGLYVRALVDGLFPGPAADADIRARLNREAAEQGVESLHNRLAAVDPESAARIAVKDLRRIVRALEVFELTGVPISEMQKTHKITTKTDGLLSHRFGLDMDRTALYARIDERVEKMCGLGFIEEVRGLVETGHTADLERIGALGYREMMAYLRGETDLETAKSLMARNTRRYAKRQMTWFRKDKRIKWLTVTDTTDFNELADTVVKDVLQAQKG
ncbi:MAG: tRNA (adenosine(37)-N6)-dimethylallyltransferase MiaA [Candidatus Hydrogenedentes bacterium]|nr:tRNA (adenosine(37)-N6)-dimethylallyltransferase MiaA [Candidatus Hydrogenedentota bacterium]